MIQDIQRKGGQRDRWWRRVQRRWDTLMYGYGDEKRQEQGNSRLEPLLARELEEGEQVLWSARPDRKRLYRFVQYDDIKADGMNALTMVLLTSGVLSFIVILMIFSIARYTTFFTFLCIIIFLLTLPFGVVCAILTGKRIPGVLYVITDQRVLILTIGNAVRARTLIRNTGWTVQTFTQQVVTVKKEDGQQRVVASFSNVDIHAPEKRGERVKFVCVKRRNGSGDLAFTMVSQYAKQTTGSFVGIADVEWVERMLRERYDGE